MYGECHSGLHCMSDQSWNLPHKNEYNKNSDEHTKDKKPGQIKLPLFTVLFVTAACTRPVFHVHLHHCTYRIYSIVLCRWACISAQADAAEIAVPSTRHNPAPGG